MNPAAYLIIAWQSVSPASDPDASVQAGRSALDRWWSGYPWYDAKTDGIRRIRVSKPWNWDWLTDWLDGLNGPNWNLGWPVTAMQWLAWTVLAIVLALVAYVLVRMYRRHWAGSAGAVAAVRRKSSDAADERRRFEALPALAERRPTDLLAEAARLYQEGRFSEAIVYLFSHELVELDRHQCIHLEQGKTNRQYLRELARRATLRRLLERTMVAFEDAFFGGYRLDRPQFESCWSQLTEFQALVAEGAA